MGTKTKSQLAKALGVSSPRAEVREALGRLSMAELKVLAKKHGLRVKGRKTEPAFFWEADEKRPPTKRQYVTSLAKVIRPEDLKRELARIR